MGLVTGYCILGTGPISAAISGITDFLGQESSVYFEKIKKAENMALQMMQREAVKKGADAIYNVRINLSEATAGHGMIMIPVSGTAIKYQ